MELKQGFLIGTTGLCLLGLVMAYGTSASKTTSSSHGGGQPQKGGTILRHVLPSIQSTIVVFGTLMLEAVFWTLPD